MTQKQLDKVLKYHKKWSDGTGGERAVLDGENLDGLNLNSASLNSASLNSASLDGASLNSASLNSASLDGASLNGASLNGASLNSASLDHAWLIGASLNGASLNYASLNGASLNSASLNSASLDGASLDHAWLIGASLDGTCLDPNAKPNADVTGFQRARGYVIGYRTRKAGHIDQYRDGRFYSADWFSVSDTECHPGLYLWPTFEQAKEFRPGEELIRVRTRPSEVHHAGRKWRCRWFEVLGTATEGDQT